MLEDGFDELAQQTVHVALAARKQALQEGDVAAVGRQQQSNVRQRLDCGQREGCGHEEQKSQIQKNHQAEASYRKHS